MKSYEKTYLTMLKSRSIPKKKKERKHYVPKLEKQKNALLAFVIVK
jgi:hypothetical protein